MKRNENLFQLIKKDHRLVSSLFSKINKTNENAGKTREKLYLELRENLDLHARAEEAVVYPQLKEREKTKDIGYEAVEEHAIMKFLFSKIDAEEPTTEEWMAQVTVLKEVVEHHVEEEEDEMFKTRSSLTTSPSPFETKAALQSKLSNSSWPGIPQGIPAAVVFGSLGGQMERYGYRREISARPLTIQPSPNGLLVFSNRSAAILWHPQLARR